MGEDEPVTIDDGRRVRALAMRQDRKESILDAAAKLFSERGYHTTSISHVIERAGISRGTFYLYFDSKETLFLELMDSFIRQIVGAVQVVDPDGPEPEGRIADNLRRVVDVVFDNRHLTLLVFRQSIGINDEVDAKLRRLYGFLQEMVQGALVNGAESGLTRACNAPLVATALIGAMKEVFFRLLVEQSDVEHDREAVTAELLDFGLGGLRKR